MAKARPFTGNQVNWNQVYYFSQVANHGSLKVAARALDLSPSTLSGHIAQLEADLEVQLFHRHHRKLELTGEGARIYQYAKQMFETGLRLIDVVSPIPLGQYPVAVGLVPSFSMPYTYELIRAFVRGQKGVNIKVKHTTHEDLEKGLSESGYDFGFTNRAPERKDLTVQLLGSSHLSFFAQPELSGRKLAELLEDLPLLVCGVEAATSELSERLLATLEITPRSIITSDYPGLVLELCRNGEGIGVFTEQAVKKLAIPGLKPLKIPKAAPRIRENLYAVWPRGGDNSAVIRSLRDFLPTEKA